MLLTWHYNHLERRLGSRVDHRHEGHLPSARAICPRNGRRTEYGGLRHPVALAILWRKRPAYHRRRLLIGTAMLTNAAFARFPGSYLPGHFFYAGTDLLIAIGVARDLWKERSVHVVYRYAMPILLVAEIAVLVPAWRYLG